MFHRKIKRILKINDDILLKNVIESVQKFHFKKYPKIEYRQTFHTFLRRVLNVLKELEVLKNSK